MVTLAPVTDGLPRDHPGFSDPAYRERRSRITDVARTYRPGAPIPVVEYSPEEDAVWAQVSSELDRLHQGLACGACRRGKARLALPPDRVPQLRDVDAGLRQLTGFRIRPAPGLVPLREFYGSLADRTFCSTQYIRHHSVPFYTPEPDVVHEIIGHANLLADPDFADLYEAAGRACRRTEGDAALDFFSRVFWFTLEFGVVHEDGALRAYGAGLLSSYGEIQVFRQAEIRPWDVWAMGTQDYDITRYQPVLFAASSPEELTSSLRDFFDGYDDRAYERLRRKATT